ncbi:hypothetical protein [Haloarcula saliterrae]|nr:hypothetical protein [Haloarcula sp. S1CR25-12]
MTKENRAAHRVCPECETSPILQQDGNAFCDICNRYMETRTLVS